MMVRDANQVQTTAAAAVRIPHVAEKLAMQHSGNINTALRTALGQAVKDTLQGCDNEPPKMPLCRHYNYRRSTSGQTI